MESQESLDRQNNLKMKNNTRGLTLPGFKTCYNDTVIKTVWCWHKDRHANQWNRIECPKINPHIHGQVVFDKGAKTIQ